MSDERTLQGTFWLMIVLQTIGSVDMPGKGARKLPAPHSYVSIIVAWALLGLTADLGQPKIASRLSLLMLLTGALLGPFGQRAIDLMNNVATNFAVTPPAPTTQPTAGTTQPRRISV
jgi:hypothetical protein